MSTGRVPSPAVAARIEARTRRRRSVTAALAVTVVLLTAGGFGYAQYSKEPAAPLHFSGRCGRSGPNRSGQRWRGGHDRRLCRLHVP